MDQPSLFERLGGKDAVEAAVDIFYTRVLNDSELKPFFNETDIEKQKGKQRLFMTYAFGGIPNYSGKNIKDAHKVVREQGLKNEHFDKVAGHLIDSLNELTVPPAMIDEIIAIVSTTRGDVVGNAEEDAD